jgi:hypothetical protein
VSRQRVSAAHKKIVELSRRLDYPVRHRGTMTIYQVTDRLHDRRTVYMRGNEIAATISAWLAELGVDSPMAEDLADAVRAPATGRRPIACRLSVGGSHCGRVRFQWDGVYSASARHAMPNSLILR